MREGIALIRSNRNLLIFIKFYYIISKPFCFMIFLSLLNDICRSRAILTGRMLQ